MEFRASSGADIWPCSTWEGGHLVGIEVGDTSIPSRIFKEFCYGFDICETGMKKNGMKGQSLTTHPMHHVPCRFSLFYDILSVQ